jgi:hypothetical protein
LGTLDGGNKGNDDAPTNKVYMRYVDALSEKAEALNETETILAQSLTA